MARSADISLLYTPQFRQFGVELPTEGCIAKQGIETDVGFGDVWITPLSRSCLVMEHNITPRNDMMLSEFTPIEYACATSVNQSTYDCMPKSGITPHPVAAPHGPWPNDTVCTFLRDSYGETKSPLKANTMYHSRSILFLPEFFIQLEKDYPREFDGVFESFNTAWDEEATMAITSAIRRISPRWATSPGANLYLCSVVEMMVAELAAANKAKRQAFACANSRNETRLAEEATSLIEHALDGSQQLSIAELAAQLYVSRSKLCAVFKQETGESVGAYMRRRRIERAEELLADRRLSIAQIAERLAFAHQSAFTQAFKQATGETPSEFRERNHVQR